MRRIKVWLLILLIVMLSALPLTRADARIVVGRLDGERRVLTDLRDSG